MLPKVIVHNSVSLDGSLTGFHPNMQLHYQIAGNFRPNAHLIGSNTIFTGMELYEDGIPPEMEADFEKQKRVDVLPYWVIVDTKGKLKGLLHVCRRFEFCRDVIILLSKTTPKEYVEHLKERNYYYHFVGENHADLEQSLKLLSSSYKVKKVLTDTGKILGNLLLEKNLVSELSILIHPIIVGKKAYNIFGDINKNIKLRLFKKEIFPKGYVWLNYKVTKHSV